WRSVTLCPLRDTLSEKKIKNSLSSHVPGRPLCLQRHPMDTPSQPSSSSPPLRQPQPTFVCTPCSVPTSFSTKGQLGYHVSLEHQNTARIRLKDGCVREFQRDQNDGLFHCPYCSFRTPSARSFRRHTARHNLPVVVDTEGLGDPESMVAAALETF